MNDGLKVFVPNFSNATFFSDNYTIADIIEFFKDCELTEKDIDKIKIIPVFNDNHEIKESNEQIDKDTLNIYYSIPKKIALTQKFQQRLRNEVPDIINEIYPDLYKIDSITFNGEDYDSIKINIKVKALNENAIENMFI